MKFSLTDNNDITSNEDVMTLFACLYALIILGLATGPAIKDWLDKQRRKKANEEYERKIEQRKLRYEEFSKCAVGNLTDAVVRVIDESQGYIPLNNCFIDIDSNYDGCCFAVKGSSPASGNKVMPWNAMMQRFGNCFSGLNEIYGLLKNPSKDTASGIIKKYFDKTSRTNKALEITIIPVAEQTVKFTSDIWFNINAREKDLETLSRYVDNMYSKFGEYVKLRNALLNSAINIDDKKKLEDISASILTCNVFEAHCCDIHRQVKDTINELKNMWKDKNIVHGIDPDDPGKYTIPFDPWINYIRPSNYIEYDLGEFPLG